MKFNVGEKVYNKTRGAGTVRKLDPENKEFQVLVRFKNGNCLAWLPEKELRPAKSEA